MVKVQQCIRDNLELITPNLCPPIYLSQSYNCRLWYLGAFAKLWIIPGNN